MYHLTQKLFKCPKKGKKLLFIVSALLISSISCSIIINIIIITIIMIISTTIIIICTFFCYTSLFLTSEKRVYIAKLIISKSLEFYLLSSND